MNETAGHKKKVLYLIVCAAPPASHSSQIVQAVQGAGWDVRIIATPEATRFIDSHALELQTGDIVRSDYRRPDEENGLPQPDVITVVPATFNTINKWAQGIADTLAVSVLCEHLGRGTRIVAIPYLKADLARHPAFSRSINLLSKRGVKFIRKTTDDGFASMPHSDEILAEIADLTRPKKQLRSSRSEGVRVRRTSTQ